MRSIAATGIVALIAMLLTACETVPAARPAVVNPADFGTLTHAIAVLTPTEGSSVRGVVTFIRRGATTTITADINGLDSNAEHAWHIHEYGDLTANDGTATGSHYNPEGQAHGLPWQPNRHAGDFGNLEADATGHARTVITVDNISIDGGRNPVLGRAIIIHARPDDGGQPTGNAGARLAQGVIGVGRSQ